MRSVLIKSVFSLVFAFGLAFFASAEQLDHWVYDATAKTISDGVWTLSATPNGAGLTVGSPVTDGYPVDPANPQELNFAKTIQLADDPSTTYDILTLNFSSANVATGNGRKITPYAWAGCIGKLVLPPTGSCKFNSFTDGAFAGATNLTEIVNFLPDEITTLGACSFRNTAAAQPLTLMGVVTCNGAHVFSDSAITSVTFGPNLTSLSGGNVYNYPGPFTSKNLTKITFDPAMSGATMSGYTLFQNSPKLTEFPDLKGFVKLNTQSPFNGCGIEMETLTIHAGVTSMNCLFMTGMKVKNLVFEGLPPDAFPMGKKGGTDTYYLNNGTVLTTYIPEKYKTEWAKWTDDGKVVDEASTTWCKAVAGTSFAKFPLIYEAKAGDLGYWIYDADEIYDGGTGTVSDTNGVWKFKATVQGTQLTVGKWLKYPSTPSELDFTQPLTDTKGYPFVFLALNTYFGADDTRHWVSGYGSCLPTEASGSVSALKYPETVVSFGSQSFGCCSNLVSVTPMLGDWVSTIGNAAFAKTGIKGDLRLMGIKDTAMGTFQFCTNLTSVTFGPDLKTFYSHAEYTRGTFQGCTSLTNVTFDAKMSGGLLGNNQNNYGYHFYGCTNLTGTLDLSGFTNLGYTREVSLKSSFSKTRYDNIIIGGKVTEMSRDAFLGMTSLTNVTFLGAPPAAAAMSKDGFAIYGTLPQKVTTTIEKAFWADWEPYVEGGLNTKHRTWKAEYVDESVDIKNRPVWVNGVKFGLLLLIK